MPSQDTRPMTPVIITSRHPALSTGRTEIWSAVSADGAWIYNRIEETGTPWAVEHLPTSTDCGLFPSLPKARRATADGSALPRIATRRSPGQPELTADDEWLYRREQED